MSTNQTNTKAKRAKSYAFKDASRIGVIVAFMVVAGWWINDVLDLGSVKSMDDVVSVAMRVRGILHPEGSVSEQFLSYLYFVTGAMVLTAAGLPRWIICAVGGLIYGAFLAIMLTTLGTTAGTLVGYVLGASLLRSTVRRRLGRRFERLSERFREDGFGYTLHLRLLPGTPGMLTNLAAGACRISIPDYTLATMLGYLPKTTMVCLIASGAIKANWTQLAMAIGVYVVFSILHYQWRKRAKTMEPLEEED